MITTRDPVERHCLFCGRQFLAMSSSAEYCSQAHQWKEWRARAMLAGTHGYVNGRWMRIEHKRAQQGRRFVCIHCGVVWPCLAAQLRAMSLAVAHQPNGGGSKANK